MQRSPSGLEKSGTTTFTPVQRKAPVDKEHIHHPLIFSLAVSRMMITTYQIYFSLLLPGSKPNEVLAGVMGEREEKCLSFALSV